MRDVVLIGLGKMGEEILNYFNTLVSDRLRFINSDTANEIEIHYIHFPLENAFDYYKYSAKLDEALKDSYSKRNNTPFYYILVGNLEEVKVVSQAIEIGYMIQILDRLNVLSFKEITTYFTYSDSLVLPNEKSKNKQKLKRIYEFFENISKYSKERRYVLPYKDKYGIELDEITSAGPYNRNYIFVTPGKEDEIHNVTIKVFSEKIFYEIYFFNSIYTQIDNEVHSRRQSDFSQNSFSTFSFVQVPRLYELQRFYLTYSIQLLILAHNLNEDIRSVNIDYYKKKFLEMIELDINDKSFPYERMTELFFRKYISHFNNLFNPYIGETEFKDYVEECKDRVSRVLDKIEKNFNPFIEDEFLHMVEIIKAVITDLFKINPMLGRFSYYDKFLSLLQEHISYWKVSLKKRYDEIEEFDINEKFEEAREKIKKINQKKILNFVLFRPIKQEKIKRVLLDIPFEKWVKIVIEKRLIGLMLDYFIDETKNKNHPLNLIVEYKEELKKFLVKLKEKVKLFEDKKNDIRLMLDYFYVIQPSKTAKEFTETLNKVESENLGIQNTKRLEGYIRNFFAEWLKDKENIHNIIFADEKDKYIKMLEDYTYSKLDNFTNIQRNIDEEEKFANKMGNEVNIRLENLTLRSFNIVSRNYLKQMLIILSPDYKKEDPLSLKINEYSSLDNTYLEKLKTEFTLGNIIFIKEYLYLPFEDVANKAYMEKYKNIADIPNDYSEQDIDKKEAHSRKKETTANADKAENKTVANTPLKKLTLESKYIRSIIKEYYSESLKGILYNKIFGEEKNTLDDNDINSLSSQVGIEKVLGLLGDAELRNLARDYEVMYSKNRKVLIERIKFVVKQKKN